MNLHLPANHRLIYNLGTLGLPEIPLLGAYRGIRAESSLPAHTHGHCMEIHFIKSGHQMFSIGERLYTVRGGDLFVTQPGEQHGTGRHPLRRGTVYWMQVDLPRKGKSLCGMSGPDSSLLIRQLSHLPARHFKANDEVAALFESLVIHLQQPPSPLQRLEVMSRISLWLLAVASCARSHAERIITPDIRTALEMMSGNPSPLTTLEAITAKLGLSKVSFHRRFKDQVGISPRDYLMDRRIEWVANQIQNTTKDITELAYEIGFSSSQYFATVFRQYMGVTPSAYRHHKPTGERRFDPRERVELVKR